MVKFWLVRLAALVVPRIPIGIARPLAIAAGTLTWALNRPARQRAVRNLARVPTLADDHARIRHVAQGVFQTTALNYLDFLRGRRLSDEEVLAGWTVENQDLLDAAMAQGKGLIMLSAHFGNFELGASRLGAMGYKLIAPAEHMRPEPLYQLFCRLREHHGVRLVPNDSRESLRELLEALKRNEVVIFVGDRYVLGASVDVPFFGHPARLASAPIALALRSGAPVMSAYAWREGPGRSHGVFYPLRLTDEPEPEPERGAPAASGQAAIAARTRTHAVAVTVHALRRFLEVLERRIEEHPEQWVSASLRVWNDEPEERPSEPNTSAVRPSSSTQPQPSTLSSPLSS